MTIRALFLAVALTVVAGVAAGVYDPAAAASDPYLQALKRGNAPCHHHDHKGESRPIQENVDAHKHKLRRLLTDNGLPYVPMKLDMNLDNVMDGLNAALSAAPAAEAQAALDQFNEAIDMFHDTITRSLQRVDVKQIFGISETVVFSECMTGIAEQTNPLVDVNTVFVRFVQGVSFWAEVCSEIPTPSTPLAHVITFHLPYPVGVPTFILAPAMVHEFVHALGFNEDTIEALCGGDCEGKLSSPNVMYRAQEYFGCSDIDGVPLHPDGQHWNSHFLATDLMTQSHGTGGLGPLTLAMLEDTILYKGNYSAVAHRQNHGSHGFHQGCRFLEEPCVGPDAEYSVTQVSEEPTAPHFCTAASPDKVCSTDRTFIASCASATKTYTSAIPEVFQYYSDTSEGGSSGAAGDYCPIPVITDFCPPGTGCLAFGTGEDYDVGCLNVVCDSDTQYTATFEGGSFTCTKPGPMTVAGGLVVHCGDPLAHCGHLKSQAATCGDLHYLKSRDELVSGQCEPARGDDCDTPYVVMGGSPYWLRKVGTTGYSPC